MVFWKNGIKNVPVQQQVKTTLEIFLVLDMMEIAKKRLLDVKAAANYLSISRAKLYQWVDAGKIPSVRIDSRRLFDILELNEFVEQLKADQRN